MLFGISKVQHPTFQVKYALSLKALFDFMLCKDRQEKLGFRHPIIFSLLYFDDILRKGLERDLFWWPAYP